MIHIWTIGQWAIIMDDVRHVVTPEFRRGAGVLSNFAASSKFATVAKSNQIKALSGKLSSVVCLCDEIGYDYNIYYQ